MSISVYPYKPEAPLRGFAAPAYADDLDLARCRVRGRWPLDCSGVPGLSTGIPLKGVCIYIYVHMYTYIYIDMRVKGFGFLPTKKY